MGRSEMRSDRDEGGGKVRIRRKKESSKGEEEQDKEARKGRK